MEPLRSTVQFGDFSMDRVAGELYRGETRIRLQEKPLQVLRLLLEHAGQVVTREDLRQHLWAADTFVDFDRNLNTAVKKLRIALCDSAETPRYVETIPRRGYRLLVTVKFATTVADEPAAATLPAFSPSVAPLVVAIPDSRWVLRRWLSAIPPAAAAILLGLLATSAGDSRLAAVASARECAPAVKLAVMPFRHEGGRGAQEHALSVGLDQEVSGELLRAKTGNLSIFSGRTVRDYLCSKKDFRQMGRELGVEYVMEGSVRRVGNGLRVTAQLFETRTGALVVAESLDVPGTQAEQAHSRIAQQVASAVLRCLTPAQRASM